MSAQSSSWKNNLFLVVTTAAITAGLMELYKRYKNSPQKDESTHKSHSPSRY